MERVRIGKDIVFQWEVRKDGAALTAEDAANLTLEIAGRNGKSQRLPFEIRDSKIIAAWYGVRQTEIGAYRLACWHNRGKVGESVVDVVWAVELVRYTTEETYDELDPVTIELEAGNLTFGVLKGDKGDTGVGIESIVETQTSEESGGVNIITVTLENGEQSEFEVRNGHGFTQAQSDKLDELPTNEELQSDLNTIPNEVVRGAEDAQFVHIEPNEQPIGLFYLRKVDSQSAGLMTAADKQKMDALPTGAYIPVMGRMTQNGFDFTNSAGTTLFSVPFADSTGGGLISFADLSRFMELGTKQELDAQFATKADKSVVDAIQALIPSQASASNQLADKDFVNSSIATSTATFRGSFNLVADLSLSVGATHAQIATALGTHIATADNNDYAFVFIPTLDATPTEIAAIERYKFNGTTWAFEYALNNSGFTAVQWAAINSGITALLVAKLQALPTASELATQFAAKEDVANKVTEIGDDSTDTQYPSAKGVWTAIKNAIAAIKQWATSLFARTDGYYSRMIVGGAESVIGDVPQTATYTFRRTGGGAIGEPVARLTEIQGNTGVVNQLLDKSTYESSKTLNGITFTNNGDGSITISGVATAVARYILQVAFNRKIVGGHKYLWSGLNSHIYLGDTYSGLIPARMENNWIWTAPDAISQMTLQIIVRSGEDISTAITIAPQCCDLTVEYGVGNEPGTVAEFEARIWRDYGKTLDEYIAYTTGKLINCKAVALESTGFNQWDEEWELGSYNINTGEPVSNATHIRSKADKPISVFPNTQYYAFNNSYKTHQSAGYQQIIFFYDKQLNYISRLAGSFGTNAVFTTPTNAAYIRFYTNDDYGTTYNHDICINISDAALNGTYRPYWKEVTNINLTTLTGINPTTGVREVMFPNGMRSKGDVRDVISGNTATVKIGDPTEQTPLENTVLATPIVYTDLQYSDGTPFVLPKNYEVQNDGTERITHAEGEDSIAPVMSAIYGLNAAGFVQDAPKDYTSQASLDSLVSVLSSITGRTISKTWSDAQGKWVFTSN